MESSDNISIDRNYKSAKALIKENKYESDFRRTFQNRYCACCCDQ